MEQIKITLKGDVREFPKGSTVADVAKAIGAGLYKAACAGRWKGETVDLRTPLEEDGELEILTFQEAEGKHAYWHTASHVMAQAVKRLFPEAKLAIGPAIENGFYYDFDLDRPLTPEDLPKIEAEIKKMGQEIRNVVHGFLRHHRRHLGLSGQRIVLADFFDALATAPANGGGVFP